MPLSLWECVRATLSIYEPSSSGSQKARIHKPKSLAIFFDSPDYSIRTPPNESALKLNTCEPTSRLSLWQGEEEIGRNRKKKVTFTSSPNIHNKCPVNVPPQRNKEAKRKEMTDSINEKTI